LWHGIAILWHGIAILRFNITIALGSDEFINLIKKTIRPDRGQNISGKKWQIFMTQVKILDYLTRPPQATQSELLDAIKDVTLNGIIYYRSYTGSWVVKENRF